MATRNATKLAQSFRLSEYTIGFIVVAVISILPETFVAINSGLSGVPEFGLGTLFGSNIADLTLIFAILVFVSGRSIKVESQILRKNVVYPFILLVPIVLGWNGSFTRLEGLALMIAGGAFYYLALRDGVSTDTPRGGRDGRVKHLVLVILSMALLLVGSHFTVDSAVTLAGALGVSPILIGMFVVGLGTTIPELFFAIEAAKERDDALAVGDILGTVLADATIVVGLLAFITPFHFPPRIIYITGIFMVAASFVLFNLMRSGRALSKDDARALFFFWVLFVLVEIAINI